MPNIVSFVKRIYSKYPKMSILYLIWFTINFVILFISDKQGASYFYPFEKNNARSGTFTYYHDGTRPHSLFHAYDYSEFVIYTITPLLVVLIVILILNNKKNQKIQ